MRAEGDGGRGGEGAERPAAREVAVTERGTFFGYGDLVVDMRNFERLRAATGAPVIFDATHSVQQPGQGAAGASGGQREHIPALLAAAAVAGADGFFLETHPDPAARAQRRRHPVAARPARRAARPHARSLGPRAWRLTPALAPHAFGCSRSTWTACSPTTASGSARSPGERVELKRFDIQDGLGLVLLRTAGIPVVWLSGRHSEATALRARSCGSTRCSRCPVPSKLEALGAGARSGAGSAGTRSPSSETIWPTSRCCGGSACRSRSPTPWPR